MVISPIFVAISVFEIIYDGLSRGFFTFQNEGSRNISFLFGFGDGGWYVSFSYTLSSVSIDTFYFVVVKILFLLFYRSIGIQSVSEEFVVFYVIGITFYNYLT